MKNLVFVVLFLFICLTSNSQEREDVVRPKLQVSMDAQSEVLSNITGWSQIEYKEGKRWEKSDPAFNLSYLPCCKNQGFESMVMYKFSLEGQPFYMIKIVYSKEDFQILFFDDATVQDLKKIIKASENIWYSTLEIKYCDNGTNLSAFDPESIIKEKSLIRLLLLNTGLSNTCNGFELFGISSQVLKGEAIIRFVIKDKYTNSFPSNKTNYFEMKRSDFEKLYTFTPYLSEKAFIKQGNEKSESGDFVGAIIDYSNAIKINPDKYSYFNSRANAKYSAKDFAGAISDYSKALSMIKIDQGQERDNASEILISMAYTKLITDDFLGAISDCDKSIEFNNEKADPYLIRVAAKKKLGINDNSICIDLGKAVKLGSKDAKVQYMEQCINYIGTSIGPNKYGNSWFVVLETTNDENKLLESQKKYQTEFNIASEIFRANNESKLIVGKNLTEDEADRLRKQLNTVMGLLVSGLTVEGLRR